jgi:plastocyanin
MRKLSVALAIASALVLAACGGGDDGGDGGETTGGDGGAGSTSRVVMVDNEFRPSSITIAAGDVELVNEGEAPHTFTVEGEDLSVEVEPGGTVTETIDLAAGDYTVFCEFHRSQGMEGTLTVEG